jgi:hypothetical protein
MGTKDVEVEIDGVKQTFTLKRLSFGEKNQLEEEATDIKIAGTTPIVKVSMSKLKEVSLLKSIVKSTIPLVGIADIQKLPSEVGDKLFEEFTTLNSVEVKKNN